MRKFFSFVIAALFSVTMFAEGTATTVYYTAPAEVIGDYSLKLNVHMGCADGDDWKQFDMVKTDKTYGEDPIYSVSFTDYWNGLCVMQFQLYDGGDWKSQKEAFSGWLAASGYNGKLYVHELGEWLPADAQPGDDAPAPEVTLKGSFDGWGDGKVLEPDDEELTASATIALEAKPYQFKIMVDGAWKGDGQTITREACTDIVFDSNGSDATLQADLAGDYTFVYTYETKKLSVIFPEGEPEPAAKYFITGNAALVGESNTWSPSAIKVVEDSYTFKDLAAGDYQLKVTIDGTWDTEKDFEDLTVVSKGLTTDNDHNINFTLEEVSDVTVTYTGEVFKVEGNFKVVEPEVVYYLIGSAEAIGAWQGEGAIKLVDGVASATLPAGDCEFKVVSEGESDWDWDHAFGFAAVDAECSSKGISEGDNGNVKIEMAAEGKLTVEIKEGKLCVTGNFVVEEEPEVVYYLVGSAEAIGAWSGDGAVKLVDGVATATLPAGVCEFKVVSEGESDWDWDHALGFAAVDAECSSKGISEGDNGNVKIEMAAEGKLTVEVKEGKLCVSGNFVVEPEPVLENGFYLIGQNGWDVEALSDDLLFSANLEAEDEEYLLNVTLAVNDEIKVVKVEKDEIKAWYPNGDNYVVDADHAGAKTIYFRPEGNPGWGEFGGFIYIADNGSTGIINSNVEAGAFKFIENGQLFIRVNDKVYSILGQ